MASVICQGLWWQQHPQAACMLFTLLFCLHQQTCFGLPTPPTYTWTN